MESYVIAVRREARERTPSDWAEQLKGIKGLTVIGTANPFRLHVAATPDAIDRARELVGGFCHIEPVILHERSDQKFEEGGRREDQ